MCRPQRAEHCRLNYSGHAGHLGRLVPTAAAARRPDVLGHAAVPAARAAHDASHSEHPPASQPDELADQQPGQPWSGYDTGRAAGRRTERATATAAGCGRRAWWPADGASSDIGHGRAR